jgi:hypothetical protein
MKLHRFSPLVRFLDVHRRLVAALAAMVCVGSLATVASGQGQVLAAVVTAAHRIEAGQVVTAADFAVTPVPAEFLPEGALTDVDAAVGQMAATGLPAGTIVTPDAFVTSSGAAAAAGRLRLLVPLANAELAAFLEPGAPIRLYVSALGETTVIDDVLVVGLTDQAAGGLFGGGSGTYVLVDVPEAAAEALASSGANVTVALR